MAGMIIKPELCPTHGVKFIRFVRVREGVSAVVFECRQCTGRLEHYPTPQWCADWVLRVAEPERWEHFTLETGVVP